MHKTSSQSENIILEILSQSENIVSKTKSKVKIQPNIQIQRVGRNKPCPCGSGKKFKNCCYRN